MVRQVSHEADVYMHAQHGSYSTPAKYVPLARLFTDMIEPNLLLAECLLYRIIINSLLVL